MKEKEIVMDLMMVDNMMDIEDVREILCVAATIVNSSEYIFMRRMTVVSSPCLMKYQHHQIMSTPFQALQQSPVQLDICRSKMQRQKLWSKKMLHTLEPM